MSILLYGYIYGRLTKRIEKKLDGNYVAAHNIEQVLEATPDKAASVRPLTANNEKLSKLDEQEMQYFTGEVRKNS